MLRKREGDDNEPEPLDKQTEYGLCAGGSERDTPVHKSDHRLLVPAKEPKQDAHTRLTSMVDKSVRPSNT